MFQLTLLGELHTVCLSNSISSPSDDGPASIELEVFGGTHKVNKDEIDDGKCEARNGDAEVNEGNQQKDPPRLTLIE